MIPLLSPYNVLCAGKWHTALLTTFSLSLSFFEAVPLHALRKSGAQHIGILADVMGYQASLAEAGVSDVGRIYDLVPLKVASGCFHPKIMVLDGPDGLRATVGSGNLTFGGWGHNIETLDLLNPALDSAAFNDLADFLEYLVLFLNEGRITASECPSIISVMTDACRRSGRIGSGGKTRLIHTFDGPMITQIASHADSLGGAEEITIVSPYFGGPQAVLALATELGCSRVRVAVTGRAPEFFDFAAARSLGVSALPVRSDSFSSTSLLHAKIIEVSCRRGRLVLSGSANATRPALVSSNNVEVSILRIVDNRLTFGWCPTDPRDPSEGEGGDPDPTGGPCLSARFDGHTIKGLLFGLKILSGTWNARIASGALHVPMPSVEVAPNGAFEIRSGDRRAFRDLVHSSQLVLFRDAAEIRGWVVFDQILGAVRERGSLAEAMIRTLAGSEEPDDIAVILSFFAATPEALLELDAGAPEADGRSRTSSDHPEGSVELADLRPTIAFEDEIATFVTAAGASATAFERLLISMRRWIREAPPPERALVDAADVDDTEHGDAESVHLLPRWRVDQVIETLANFVEALPCGSTEFRKHAVSFLDFVLFTVERSEESSELKSAHIRRWINIVKGAGSAQSEPDVLDRAFVAVLASRVIIEPSQSRNVHALLQEWCRGLLDPEWVEVVMPRSSNIREQRLIPNVHDDAWADAIQQTTTTRTSWMDADEVRQALAGIRPMPDLPVVLAPEAAILRQVAAASGMKSQRVLTLGFRRDKPACPRCYLVLPLFARQRLREYRIVLTPCCGRILIDLAME